MATSTQGGDKFRRPVGDGEWILETVGSSLARLMDRTSDQNRMKTEKVHELNATLALTVTIGDVKGVVKRVEELETKFARKVENDHKFRDESTAKVNEIDNMLKELM